jgi:hypothetical protein
MIRLSIRFAALALAAGATLVELAGVSALAQRVWSDSAIAALPRVVITPASPEDAPGETVRTEVLASKPSPRS